MRIDLVDVEEDEQIAVEDLQALGDLVQAVLGAPQQDLVAVVEEGLQDLLAGS